MTKISVKNQKEVLILIAASIKKSAYHQNIEDPNSEMENIHPASTSIPVKSKATTSKSTPISSSNIQFSTD